MTSENVNTDHLAQAASWLFDVKPLHSLFGFEISDLTLEQAASDTLFGGIY